MNGAGLQRSQSNGKASFAIEADPQRSRVDVTVTGMFDLAFAGTYSDALNDVFGKMQRTNTSIAAMVIDMRDMSIHTREVAAFLQAEEARYPVWIMRIAIVARESALQAMQVRRLSGRSEARFFDAPDDANRWVSAA